jgi:uncharacterized protein YjbI with pentapeptide repeats
MANPDHIALLMKGVNAWNAWRDENRDIRPDLGGAHLTRADLRQADLREADLWEAYFNEADLREANLRDANLWRANLSAACLSDADLRGAQLGDAYLAAAKLVRADLRKADLSSAIFHMADLREVNLSRAELWSADLSGANLRGADLSRAELGQANLSRADLTGAKLDGADLYAAILVEADLTGADLTGCRIYGVSAWGVKLDSAKQQNLIITPENESEITVDNIEVAQFIYLLLHNEKIRDVIDTITSKAVLILGRFTDDRKAVLDVMRDKLRERGYLPILFDFEGSLNRSTDETIALLARMARFVIADISEAKSVLQELRSIVPNLPSVPVQPIIVATQEEPGMFDFYHHFHWFLKVHRYNNEEQLIIDVGERVILPAEAKIQELRRLQPPSMRPAGGDA